MVVEHGERMQPAGAQGDMALEVHLPQIVGGFVLEADEGLCPAALQSELDPVAAQDAGHRRGRRCAETLASEHTRDLAPTPGRMRRTHPKGCRFDLRGAAPWAQMGLPRTLQKPRIALRSIASDQLVRQRPADSEAPTQRAHI